MQSYPVDSHDVYRDAFKGSFTTREATREEYNTAYDYYSEDHKHFRKCKTVEKEGL